VVASAPPGRLLRGCPCVCQSARTGCHTRGTLLRANLRRALSPAVRRSTGRWCRARSPALPGAGSSSPGQARQRGRCAFPPPSPPCRSALRSSSRCHPPAAPRRSGPTRRPSQIPPCRPTSTCASSLPSRCFAVRCAARISSQCSHPSAHPSCTRAYVRRVAPQRLVLRDCPASITIRDPTPPVTHGGEPVARLDDELAKVAHARASSGTTTARPAPSGTSKRIEQTTSAHALDVGSRPLTSTSPSPAPRPGAVSGSLMRSPAAPSSSPSIAASGDRTA
jgi:hypothetical protein